MTHNLEPDSFLVAQTGKLVAAYVSRNSMPAQQLPILIETLHSAVKGLRAGSSTVSSEAPSTPTTEEIRASIQWDGIVSFIDGKYYKTLKRHLTAHGLSPERYRARYGLPANYPMVAASYSARRAALARQIQQGQPAG